jgi:hypothetical protein
VGYADKDRIGSHQPPIILAEQHAVGRREADIDLVAFAKDMRIDDRIGLELETLRLDGIDGRAAEIRRRGDLALELVQACLLSETAFAVGQVSTRFNVPRLRPPNNYMFIGAKKQRTFFSLACGPFPSSLKQTQYFVSLLGSTRLRDTKYWPFNRKPSLVTSISWSSSGRQSCSSQHQDRDSGSWKWCREIQLS